jgi:hypothetical protein
MLVRVIFTINLIDKILTKKLKNGSIYIIWSWYLCSPGLSKRVVNSIKILRVPPKMLKVAQGWTNNFTRNILTRYLDSGQDLPMMNGAV